MRATRFPAWRNQPQLTAKVSSRPESAARGPQRQVFVVGVESGVPKDRSSSLRWKSGSPTTGLRRWGGKPGSLTTGLRRWGGNRGPQGQVFVVGVKTGVPKDRSSSLGWSGGRSGGICPENSCLHQSQLTTRVSSRLESALADGVEGSAVAFSWLRVEHSSMQDCGYIFMISGGIRITTNSPTCSNGMPPLYTKLCPHPVQRNPPQAMNRAAENSIIPPKAAVVPAII